MAILLIGTYLIATKRESVVSRLMGTTLDLWCYAELTRNRSCRKNDYEYRIIYFDSPAWSSKMQTKKAPSTTELRA